MPWLHDTCFSDSYVRLYSPICFCGMQFFNLTSPTDLRLWRRISYGRSVPHQDIFISMFVCTCSFYNVMIPWNSTSWHFLKMYFLSFTPPNFPRSLHHIRILQIPLITLFIQIYLLQNLWHHFIFRSRILFWHESILHHALVWFISFFNYWKIFIFPVKNNCFLGSPRFLWPSRGSKWHAIFLTIQIIWYPTNLTPKSFPSQSMIFGDQTFTFVHRICGS